MYFIQNIAYVKDTYMYIFKKIYFKKCKEHL
jgi:hypothetical protein